MVLETQYILYKDWLLLCTWRLRTDNLITLLPNKEGLGSPRNFQICGQCFSLNNEHYAFSTSRLYGSAYDRMSPFELRSTIMQTVPIQRYSRINLSLVSCRMQAGIFFFNHNSLWLKFQVGARESILWDMLIKNLTFRPYHVFSVGKKSQYNWVLDKQRYFNPRSGCLLLLSKSSKIYPQRVTRDIRTDLCTRMFIAVLLTNMKQNGRQPKCPTTGDSLNDLWCVCTLEYYEAIKHVL